MKNEITKIILDTSSLHCDPMLQGAKLSFIIGCSNELGIQVCIPDTVLTELTNQFCKDLEKAKYKRNSAIRDIERLTLTSTSKFLIPRSNCTRSDPATDTNFLAEEILMDRRQRVFDNPNVELLPTPDINTKSLVEHSIKCTKPFKDSGEGLADAIIWHTVLTSLKPGERAIFVTNNSRDYISDNCWHPDLKHQLSEIGLRPDELIWAKDLQEVIDRFILPRVSSLTDITPVVRSGKLDGFDINKFINNSVALDFEGQDISQYGSNLEIHNLKYTITKIDRLHNIECKQAQRRSSGEVLLRAIADLDVELNYYGPEFDSPSIANSGCIRLEIDAILSPTNYIPQNITVTPSLIGYSTGGVETLRIMTSSHNIDNSRISRINRYLNA